jgi:hypothetical protein
VVSHQLVNHKNRPLALMGFRIVHRPTADKLRKNVSFQLWILKQILFMHKDPTAVFQVKEMSSQDLFPLTSYIE